MYALTYTPARSISSNEWEFLPTVVLSGLTYEAAHEALTYAYGLQGWSISSASIVHMGGAA